MDAKLKELVWQQFGAAIETLSDAINLCPDELWTLVVWKDEEDERYGQFWFVAYHTIFSLDLYLTGKSEGFLPPPPFVRGRLPDTLYTKEQVRGYLNECRAKCKATIEALTDETAYRLCKFDWMELTFLELQLYCMRHMMEHAAQLNLVLGQHDITGQDWIPQASAKAS